MFMNVFKILLNLICSMLLTSILISVTCCTPKENKEVPAPVSNEQGFPFAGSYSLKSAPANAPVNFIFDKEGNTTFKAPGTGVETTISIIEDLGNSQYIVKITDNNVRYIKSYFTSTEFFMNNAPSVKTIEEARRQNNLTFLLAVRI